MSEQMAKAFEVEEREERENELIDNLRDELNEMLLDRGEESSLDRRVHAVLDKIGDSYSEHVEKLGVDGESKGSELPEEALVDYATTVLEVEKDKLYKDLVDIGDNAEIADRYREKRDQLRALGIEITSDSRTEQIEYVLGD